MFSGKSESLISLTPFDESVYNAYKPKVDVRNGNFIVSRACNRKIPCRMIDNPEEILNSPTDTIIIDEAQFFSAEQLKNTVLELKVRNKKVIIGCLDLKATKEEWKTYTEIYSIATKIIRLEARCYVCGKPAKFTSLIQGQKGEDVQIESDNVVYQPTCEEHYA
jgi:thymidine kinase